MPVFPATPLAPGDPGSLIAGDYQYEFKGLLFGSGTDFTTIEVTGLLGSSSSNSEDTPRGAAHGSIPGFVSYGTRIIQATIKISGDVEGNLDLARRAFQLPRIRHSRRLVPLVFKRPGLPMRYVNARCTKNDIPSNWNTARGLAQASVEFQAPDPLVYALEARYDELTLLPGQTTGTIILTQIGTHEDGASPVIEISGPATNPVIRNETDDDRAFYLNVVLDSTDAVRLDFGKKTVEVRRGTEGEWVRDYTIVSTQKKWWNLLPGPNTVHYSRTGSALASTMHISWQDVWS